MLRFWKIIFNNIFRNRFFFGNILTDKIVSGQICSWPGAVSFLLGGRARKITPVIYPLIFKNFFGHEIGRRGSYGINSKKKVGQKIMPMPDLRSKVAWVAYFVLFLDLFWVKILVEIFGFFLG